jgi:hypothetical protein
MPEIIGTDQQFAGPIRLRSLAMSDRRKSVASVLVRDRLEPRPVVAACAAFADTGDEPVRECAIVAGSENGPDLSLNTAKILQPVGVGP